MNSYSITYKTDKGSIKSGTITANNEEEARNIFYSSVEDCNIILKVEPVQ